MGAGGDIWIVDMAAHLTTGGFMLQLSKKHQFQNKNKNKQTHTLTHTNQQQQNTMTDSGASDGYRGGRDDDTSLSLLLMMMIEIRDDEVNPQGKLRNTYVLQTLSRAKWFDKRSVDCHCTLYLVLTAIYREGIINVHSKYTKWPSFTTLTAK